MDKLTIRMISRTDRNDHEYFMSTCQAPCLIDLSNCVIHFFPDDEGGGDLVIRKYDKKDNRQNGEEEEGEGSSRRKPRVIASGNQ